MGDPVSCSEGLDCAGECGGSAVMDCAGTCNGAALIVGDNCTNISYFSTIQPIFTANCNGCHIGGTSGGLNLSVGSSYGNLYNITSQNYSPALRVAQGSSENSVLYNKISNTGTYGGAMPQGSSGLSSSNSELIEKWINEGAQNN